MLNAAAVARLRAEPIAALAERLAAAQAELERLAPRARRADIRVRIKDGGKAWPWPDFVRRVEAHVRNHEHELRRTRPRT